MREPARMIVNAPPRGGTLESYWQENPVAMVTNLEITRSWGAQAGSGLVHYAVPAGYSSTIAVGAMVRVVTGYGHLFYGLVKSDNWETSSRGQTRVLELVDLRELLDYDCVFSCWNMPETRIVNGVRTRRYWHILPGNFGVGTKTYTVAPYTAGYIVNWLFNSPTVETSWTLMLHADMSLVLPGGWPTYPVLGLNFQGTKLSAALVEICEKLQLTFTHAPTEVGPFQLWFARKGETALPTYAGGSPAGSLIYPPRSDDWRTGYGMTGQATRATVLGDRNLYQVLNVTLQRDWNKNWEWLWELSTRFVTYIYENFTTDIVFGTVAVGTRYNAITGDTYRLQGWKLAEDRARRITVREFHALNAVSGGEYAAHNFLDYRLYAGRCRNDMPAWLYVQQLVFKAFRPPNPMLLPVLYTTNLVTRRGVMYRNLDSMRMVSENLCGVTYSPDPNNYQPMAPDLTTAPQSNGFALVRGYCVGRDAFEAISPERFNPAEWLNPQSVWSPATFRIDESGEDGGYVLFDEAIIQSWDLVTEADGPANAKYAVFKANPTLAEPQVVASLTFEAERFNWRKQSAEGTQLRDETETVSGLRGEFLVNGSAIVELPFADGLYSGDKADAICGAMLSRPLYSVQGGFRRALQTGDTPVPMHDSYDRITVSINPGGHVESVDFVIERAAWFVPERDLDRRRVVDTLFEGQEELMQESRALRTMAMALRSDPGTQKTVVDAWNNRMGEAGMACMTVHFEDGAAGTLEVGTPVWSKVPAADGQHAVVIQTANTSTSTPVFVGVTVRDKELATQPIRVQTSGDLLARVMGPVSVGDSVGRSDGHDYLEKDGQNTVGTVKADHTEETVVLMRVATGGGGGGAGYEPRWA